jgi:hypothetical protein
MLARPARVGGDERVHHGIWESGAAAPDGVDRIVGVTRRRNATVNVAPPFRIVVAHDGAAMSVDDRPHDGEAVPGHSPNFSAPAPESHAQAPGPSLPAI